MGTYKIEVLLDSARWLDGIDASGGDIETLQRALERLVDEGLAAIRGNLPVDARQEANVENGRLAGRLIDNEYKVVNGDTWCRRHSGDVGVDSSVDIIVPLKGNGASCGMLAEGKLGSVSPRRHPRRVELERKYVGTLKQLAVFGVNAHPTLFVIVSENVRNMMKWRIGNWMRGTHDVHMVSCCPVEFLGRIDILPRDRPWSLVKGKD